MEAVIIFTAAERFRWLSVDIAQLEEHVRFVPSGDISGGFTHLIVRDKGERCVELTLRQSRGLQGRRDDRAGCDARRRAKRRWRNLRNRETCGSKGRRDCGVGIERVTRLPFFLSKRMLGRTGWQFGSCSSDDKGAAVS